MSDVIVPLLLIVEVDVNPDTVNFLENKALSAILIMPVPFAFNSKLLFPIVVEIVLLMMYISKKNLEVIIMQNYCW